MSERELGGRRRWQSAKMNLSCVCTERINVADMVERLAASSDDLANVLTDARRITSDTPCLEYFADDGRVSIDLGSRLGPGPAGWKSRTRRLRHDRAFTIPGTWTVPESPDRTAYGGPIRSGDGRAAASLPIRQGSRWSPLSTAMR